MILLIAIMVMSFALWDKSEQIMSLKNRLDNAERKRDLLASQNTELRMSVIHLTSELDKYKQNEQSRRQLNG
jgi:hypothetical protein